MSKPVTIDYTNYRGERGVRIIYPEKVFWGRNEWHPIDQWLMEAFDVEKNALRTFAMKDIHGWDVTLPKGTVSKTTVLHDCYATGDYEAFCFDTHEGPREHCKATAKAREAYYEDRKQPNPEKCRVYPEALLPEVDRNKGRPFGKWEIKVTFTPKEPPAKVDSEV